VTQIRTFEALRRIDWSGEYIAWAHIEAEEELERIKDPKFYVLSANALFADALRIQKEIVQAAKEAGGKYPPAQMTEGWIAGMVVEAALKGAGADATMDQRQSFSSQTILSRLPLGPNKDRTGQGLVLL
jgi:branched-chain amino acid transport system substrate-binding protein